MCNRRIPSEHTCIWRFSVETFTLQCQFIYVFPAQFQKIKFIFQSWDENLRINVLSLSFGPQLPWPHPFNMQCASALNINKISKMGINCFTRASILLFFLMLLLWCLKRLAFFLNSARFWWLSAHFICAYLVCLSLVSVM